MRIREHLRIRRMPAPRSYDARLASELSAVFSQRFHPQRAKRRSNDRRLLCHGFATSALPTNSLGNSFRDSFDRGSSLFEGEERSLAACSNFHNNCAKEQIWRTISCPRTKRSFNRSRLVLWRKSWSDVPVAYKSVFLAARELGELQAVRSRRLS